MPMLFLHLQHKYFNTCIFMGLEWNNDNVRLYPPLRQSYTVRHRTCLHKGWQTMSCKPNQSHQLPVSTKHGHIYKQDFIRTETHWLVYILFIVPSCCNSRVEYLPPHDPQRHHKIFQILRETQEYLTSVRHQQRTCRHLFWVSTLNHAVFLSAASHLCKAERWAFAGWNTHVDWEMRMGECNPIQPLSSHTMACQVVVVI